MGDISLTGYLKEILEGVRKVEGGTGDLYHTRAGHQGRSAQSDRTPDTPAMDPSDVATEKAHKHVVLLVWEQAPGRKMGGSSWEAPASARVGKVVTGEIC